MKTLGRLCLWLLAAFGAASLLGTAWFVLGLWYETQVAPPIYAATAPVSPTARKVAGWISPGLQKFALASEDRFVALAPTPISRWIARRAFPYAVKAIPPATEVGCDAALDRLGAMTAGEMARMVVEHQTAKGRDAHWTVRGLAESSSQ
jgi:hypothetical protein